MDSGYNISDAYVERSLREQIAHMAKEIERLLAIEKAARQYLIATKHLNPCPGTMQVLEDALK